MSKKRNKQPNQRATPPQKQIRQEKSPESTNNLNPIWSISIFDTDGPWGACQLKNSDLLLTEILPKMRNYESLTWGQIFQNKNRNHSVEVEQLVKKAQERLAELNLDDFEDLFRFRLDGELRIWGVRDGRIFRILWCDPNHEVCPSNRKHT